MNNFVKREQWRHCILLFSSYFLLSAIERGMFSSDNTYFDWI